MIWYKKLEEQPSPHTGSHCGESGLAWVMCCGWLWAECCMPLVVSRAANYVLALSALAPGLDGEWEAKWEWKWKWEQENDADEDWEDEDVRLRMLVLSVCPRGACGMCQAACGEAKATKGLLLLLHSLLARPKNCATAMQGNVNYSSLLLPSVLRLLCAPKKNEIKIK